MTKLRDIVITDSTTEDPAAVNSDNQLSVEAEIVDANGLNLELTASSNAPISIEELATNVSTNSNTQQKVSLHDAISGIAALIDSNGRLAVYSKDWFQEIAEGLVPGYTFIEKFGENPVISTATDPEDLWDGGGIYTFSTTANIDSISSSDNTDTQIISIFGLDVNWEEVTQNVTLTGQATATLATPLIRIFRMRNMGSTDIAGIVYCYINGATVASGVPTTTTDRRAIINNGNNQTLMCIYTVPAGKTGYFWSGYVAISRGGGVSASADFTWRARLEGGVFAVQSRISAITSGNSSWDYMYKISLPLPEKTDVLIRCEEVSATVGVSGGFTVLLKDN